MTNIGEACNCNEVDHEILSEELRTLKTKVQNLSLQLISKSKMLNTLRDTLKEMLITGSYQPLPGIIREITKEISFEKDWLTLEENYDYITQGFIQKLTAQHPSLSQAEVRICILIRQGFKSKEIAEIVHLSKHTIDAHRKSIRKKMAAPQDMDLDSILDEM